MRIDVEKTTQLLNGISDLSKALGGADIVRGYIAPYYNPISGFDIKAFAKDKTPTALVIGGIAFAGWRFIRWRRSKAT